MSSGAPLRLPLNQLWPEILEWKNNSWVRVAAQGFNVFKLMQLCDENSYESPFWLTLAAGEAAGGILKEGAQGVNVIAWRKTDKDLGWKGDISESNAGSVEASIEGASQEEKEKVVAMRPRVVFNASQWENIPELPNLIERKIPTREEAIEKAQKIATTGAGCEIRFETLGKGTLPFYNPSLNYISMPAKESFKNLREYYWALFEQIGHALASRHQLDLFKGEIEAEFSNSAQFKVLYAKMTAAMLAYETGIDVLE